MVSGVLFGNLVGNNSTRANKIVAAMARDITVVIRVFLVFEGEEG